MPGKSGGTNTGVGIEGGLILLFVLILVALISSASKNPGAKGLPLSSSTSTIPENGPIFVNIINPGAKVKNAIVRVLETGETDTLDQNTLSLKTCSKGQHISVWTPGYYILTFPCADNPTIHYDVQLEALNPSDNTNYQWIGAGGISDPPPNCASCHAGSLLHLNEYPDWHKDNHSKVFANPYFWTTYLGTNISRQPSQQIQWTILADGQKIYPLLDPMKPDYGAGYRLDYPVSNGNCAYCHVPASSPGTLQEMNVADLIDSHFAGQTNAMTEGITCDVCHKETDVLVGKNQLPYDDRPGVLSMSIVRPISDQHFNYGPLAYQSMLNLNSIPNSDAKRTCFPIFSESKFCAACHYGKFANTLIYGSYQEWLASPYREKYVRSADGQIVRENPDYRSCQDCHMIGQEKVVNTLPSQRDACSDTNLNFSDFNHNMMNYGPDPDNPSREIPLLVKNAAQMKLEPRLEGGQIKVKLTVLNTRAGHKFPTDSPLRHLILLVEATDWRGNNLTQSGGPMIPVWAAPDKAGKAGEIFANILKDKDTNLAPSFAYWNPVETAWQGADTRLVPGIPVQSEYSFAAPYDRTATLRATLIYRDVFFNVAKQKSWPIMDIMVTEVDVECTGFGEVPENMTCQTIKR